jgi:hypothetical protein
MSATVLFFAAALVTPAPAGQQPPKPSSNTAGDRLAAAAVPRTVSVEGCVALESEITGGKATLGERTGLDRHFVLARSKVVKGKTPAPAAVDAAGMAPVYKISGLTDEQLKIHVGRRVRIEGAFGSPSRSATPVGDAGASDPSSEPSAFVELNVATIRQVPGTCSIPRS